MDFICKLSIGLAVTWLFYWLLLRRLTFYRWNRLFLLVYPAVAYLVPFIDITDLLPLRGEGKAWFQAIPVLTQYSFQTESQEGIAWTSAAVIGLLVLATGSIFMTVRFCWQYWSLRKTVSGAVLLADDDARLYHVDKQIVPFSFGRSIYLNKHLHTEAELQEILRHEFIHVKQRHSLDMLWGELLCILNWYNPFAWLLRKAIRQNLEFIADHQVLANGVDRKQYQYLLLKVTGIATFSAANNFNLSSLKKRIIMMNKKTSASVHLLRFVLVVPVLAVLLLAFRSVTHTDFPSPSNLLTDRILTDTVKQPGQAILVTQTGDTIRLDELTIAIDTVPVIRKSAKKDNDVSISIHQKNNIVTVRKNGVVEKFDFNDPKQKEAFENKYGPLKPPPPPPAKPGMPAPAAAPAPPAPPTGAHPVPAPAPPVPPAPPKEKNEVVVVGHGTQGKVSLSVVPAGATAVEIKTGSAVITTTGEKVVTNFTTSPTVQIRGVEGQLKPLYVIDGKLSPNVELNQIPPNTIASVHVLKGTNAVARYGPQGTNGVIEIITKDPSAPATVNVPVKLSDNLCDLDGIIIIDGKKVDCKEATAYMKKNKDRIATINVFKGTENVKKGTGQDAKNAIIIQTKAD